MAAISGGTGSVSAGSSAGDARSAPSVGACVDDDTAWDGAASTRVSVRSGEATGSSALSVAGAWTGSSAGVVKRSSRPIVS